MQATLTPPRARRSVLRLPAHDFRHDAVCYVTLRVVGRDCLFGELRGDAVRLGAFGELVRREWIRAAFARADVHLDDFIVMPNHLHGIVMLTRRRELRDALAARTSGKPTGVPALGAFVAGVKATTAVQINHARGTPGAAVWQRGHEERPIRDERELDHARRHLADNPVRWMVGPG